MRAMMALRASAVTTRPSPPPSKSAPAAPTRRSPTLPLLPPSSTTAAVSLLTLFCTPGSHCEAKAFTFPKEDILSSLSKVESALDQVEKVSTNVLDYTVSASKVLYDALRTTIDVAAPVVQKASEEAVKAASPIASEASKQAQGVLQDAGVDPGPVSKTVVNAAEQSTKIIEGAKPVASATLETLLSSDPSVLLGSAGVLFLAYLLLPAVWSGISFTFRGYKGNLSPAQALDLVCSKNYVIVDVRSEKDKSKAGVPRLPPNAKNNAISIPLEDLPSRLKGLVRDVKKVEAELVALKISYLKRVGKGSNIVILDSYSDSAKTVARVLNYLGFKNAWVITDGFSGRRGWIQSRLGYDSYMTSFAEIISPSRVIPAASRFGSTSSRGSRKLLPGKADA